MNINEKYYCSKCMRELTAETTCSFCGYVPDSHNSRQVLEEGTLLQNGRYQLGAVLGAGGFGITYQKKMSRPTNWVCFVLIERPEFWPLYRM